jgi:hypothetical protein
MELYGYMYNIYEGMTYIGHFSGGGKLRSFQESDYYVSASAVSYKTIDAIKTFIFFMYFYDYRLHGIMQVKQINSLF